MPADLLPMAVASRPPEDYAASAGTRAVEAVRDAAASLAGARVLHVSFAGAPARLRELLRGMLALQAGAGLSVEWRVLFGDRGVRRAAEALRNGLRGAELGIADADRDAYRAACDRLARALRDEHDLVVLHDPETLGLAPALTATAAWRCHVGASAADPQALDEAAGLVEACAAVLAPDASFLPERLRGGRGRSAALGIDPLGPRAVELEPRLPGRLVRALGVDLERPFCLQEAELDRWDDPQAAIELLELARAEEPGLQLVVAARLGDAEEWRAAAELAAGGGAPGLVLLTSHAALDPLELGSLQRLARVSLDFGLAQRFPLAACEALWKRTPVVGGAGAGLEAAVRDGVDGFLADGPAAAAARVLELVRDPGLALELGRAGRARVHERFLLPGAVERELRALAGLV
jgi:trehalose synthase